MEIATTILDRLEAMGYPDSSINLWGKSRLYVNLKGQIPFFYDLEDHAKVVSHKKLPLPVFKQACTLCPFLMANRAACLRQLDEGRYYTRKQTDGKEADEDDQDASDRPVRPAL